jgi:hypothetical protein
MSSRAAKICAGEIDPPKSVQSVIGDVEYHVARVAKLTEAALLRGDITQEEADTQAENAHASAYVYVDGECIEVHRDSPRHKTRLTHQPERPAPEDGNLADLTPQTITPDDV